MHESYLIPPLC